MLKNKIKSDSSSRLTLRTETLRVLTKLDLQGVHAAEAHPTAINWGCLARAGTTSEAEGAGPCPGEYSWTCSP